VRSNPKSEIRNLKFFFLLALLLTGCGVPGIPRPPSLDLPEPPNDLRATRKGNKVTLTWTQPKETTDKEAARHLGRTRICRAVVDSPTAAAMKTCDEVGVAEPKPVPRATEQQPVEMNYRDTLSPELESANATSVAQYSVSVQNARGRAAGLSNEVAIPLAPTLPAPSGLAASVQADGVHLTANAPAAPAENSRLRYTYRIYRSSVPTQSKETPALVAEIPGNEKIEPVDISFAWEQHYAYRITTATTLLSPGGTPVATVEGEDSQAVEVFTHDVFPPATPTGLEAVFSGLEQQRFIDLTWNANSEADLAGYNVYRSEEGGEPAKINTELIKTPAFRDANVAAGHTYLYSISAADLRNNESPRSAETSETVPQ
jgi:hypothetical protein